MIHTEKWENLGEQLGGTGVTCSLTVKIGFLEGKNIYTESTSTIVMH